MELEDFLKVKKVQCVTGSSYNFLTVGELYEVIGVSHGRIKIHNNKGGDSWYDMDWFEPVIEPVETSPQNAEWTRAFEVGDKVYFGVNPKIQTIESLHAYDNIKFVGVMGCAHAKQCCHATQENYERLKATFTDIEFEQPPTQADIDNEAVDKLAKAMKDKLAEKRKQGYHGWATCKHGDLVQLLINHVDKGDPIDVANFCAFLFARGEQLTQGGT